MTMKAYVARYKEINDYLPVFPKYGNSLPCIPEDEMIENFANLPSLQPGGKQ